MRPDHSFVAQPVRSLQTMLRVLSQEDPALPIIIPDGIYDQNTMQAITVYQTNKGIIPTGITDQNTWEAIVDDYDDTLIRIGRAESIEIVMEPGEVFALGASNAYIYLLQSILLQLSFDHSSIAAPEHSGILDTNTSNSLRSFQGLSGLPQTGELDKITWKHLVKQFSLSAQRNRHASKENSL